MSHIENEPYKGYKKRLGWVNKGKVPYSSGPHEGMISYFYTKDSVIMLVPDHWEEEFPQDTYERVPDNVKVVKTHE